MKTVYLVVQVEVVNGKVFVHVKYRGSKKQCERHADYFFAAKIITENTYNQLLACLM